MSYMHLFLYMSTVVFLIGLCIGSFLNVVALRGLSGESIAFPASKCPSCQKPLKWWHNIPVISYLFLRGKCAFCKEKISIQYPIVEIVTAILFLGIFYRYGFEWQTLFIWIFTAIFIVLTITDIKEQVVCDAHTYILTGTGLIWGFLNIGHYYGNNKIWIFSEPVIATIGGVLLGIVIMEILARSGYLFAGTRSFGDGDSYIAAGMGAIFGWKYIVPALILSLIISIIFTLPVFLKKLFDTKQYTTLAGFGLFASYASALIYFSKNGILENITIYMLAVILLAILGLWLCHKLINSMKIKGDLTYLPFGPAMVLASFIYLIGGTTWLIK